MSSSYNTPFSKHKLVVSIYSNTETSLAMSTLAIWCRVVRSRDVRSRVFSRPLVAPRAGFALVPCGHARFCEYCAMRVSCMDFRMPFCRADITVVMRIFLI